MRSRTRRLRAAATLLLTSSLATSALAAEADGVCETVRFSDVGWTDITVTTAVASRVLEGLGYKTKVHNLSVPVTYASLKNRDVDVFLGNWMPTMAADLKPYAEAGTVETLRPILEGARYTLAVSRAAYNGGLRSFDDLARHKEKLKASIYGIEPGNDGNRLIRRMIDDNAYGLAGWKLVESSEQAMLLTVGRAIKAGEWVVFLGWEPHPMNRKLELAYLAGGDAYFGPEQGRSTVYINVRKDYGALCPGVTAFLRQLSFTLAEESELMAAVLDDKRQPSEAAEAWLKQHPEKLDAWLAGVPSAQGGNGLAALRASLGVPSSH